MPSLKNCFPSWIYLPPQLEFHHDDVVITSSGTEQIDLRTWKFVYQGRGYAVQILLLKVIELFELQSGTFSRKRRTDGDNCRGINPRMRANPMNRTDSWRVTLPLAQAAPRCGARNRAGGPCRSPAMANGRCRLHGGLSTGAPRGERHGMWRHGLWSIEAVERRRQTTAEMRQLRLLIRSLREE